MVGQIAQDEGVGIDFQALRRPFRRENIAQFARGGDLRTPPLRFDRTPVEHHLPAALDRARFGHVVEPLHSSGVRQRPARNLGTQKKTIMPDSTSA